ncbi:MULTISPECIES: mandelate racemase/muconate lactonizing enzyme family protein [Bacillus]|uniref:mandelate racemase/muconate lactonizing enzyme family protein n=1 Tax=Bacillus sp. SKDU12 TaxID=1337053 RepID=UPI001389F2EE|nr:isomerase [Bacillus sp. SKDU12]
MKIVQIETFPLLHRLEKPYGDANGLKRYRTCYLIRIVTESGIDGWGECVDWLPALHIGFTKRIIPYLLGKQAGSRLLLVRTIQKWHQRAASAVSMALTEIAAKAADYSVCELWGGQYREEIPVYASFQSYSDQTQWISHSVSNVEAQLKKGFKQMKVKIGGMSFEEDLRHIKALQHTAGSSITMILDANQSYDAATALKWERYFSAWMNIGWLEEPLPFDQPQDYALLRSRLSVPVAGGENIKSAAQFVPLLSQRYLDIIQPDVMHVNGIDGFRDCLQLARYFGIRASAHAYDGSLSRLYALFAQACLPPWTKMENEQIEPIEWDVMENPFTDLISVQPSKGIVHIPKGKGIGTEINMEIVNRCKWDGSAY